MLVMSDVSGPGIAQTGLSYLTGYPLQESGLYALSTTWAAPEMSRPGCVWTHTLLIGFSDLATLDTPSLITTFFQRPSSLNVELFSNELTANLNSSLRTPLTVNEREWFATLATGLYDHPSEQIWARRAAGVDVNNVLLRLWDQQWPRLRRSFKFCTLTTRDRSQESIQFDLQLTQGSESSARLRFASTMDGFEATKAADGLWLENLVRDADEVNQTSLREMLRSLGVDVLGGREAMKPICTLHAVFDAPVHSGLPQAIILAQSVPPLSTSELAMTMVVRYALSAPEKLRDGSLAFVLDHLHVLPSEDLSTYANALAQAQWQSNPREFIQLSCKGNDQLRVILRAGASSIARELVLKVLPQIIDLVEPLLDILPDLTTDCHFWDVTQVWPSLIANKSKWGARDVVLRAMIQGLREDGAINSALQMVRVSVALMCVQNLLHEKNSNHDVLQLHRWVRLACNDAEEVAIFLEKESDPSSEMLRFIVSAMLPDAIPNVQGLDPWLLALSRLRANEGGPPTDLCAYGFRRALGWRSKNVEQLLVLTFEPLHNAALHSSIHQESWSLLEGALPWVSSSKARDHALRLRQAVAKKCVEMHISAEFFFSLTSNESLLTSIFDEILGVWGGRQYLRKLEEILQGIPQRAPLQRLVHNYLKQHSKFW